MHREDDVFAPLLLEGLRQFIAEGARAKETAGYKLTAQTCIEACGDLYTPDEVRAALAHLIGSGEAKATIQVQLSRQWDRVNILIEPAEAS